MLVSMTPTTLNLLRDFLHAIRGIRPDRSQANHSYFQSTIAHVLNGKSRRHRVRALQEEDDFGVIGHELFDPGIVAAPEDLRELVVNLLRSRPSSLPWREPVPTAAEDPARA